MRKILVILSLFISTQIMATGDQTNFDGLYGLKIEAQTSLNQIAFVYDAIERHETIESSKMICFELGQLFTYLFNYSLAIDGARGEFGDMHWETRFIISQPFALRATTMGACGLMSDPSLPEGDFAGLRQRLGVIEGFLQDVVTRL